MYSGFTSRRDKHLETIVKRRSTVLAPLEKTKSARDRMSVMSVNSK